MLERGFAPIAIKKSLGLVRVKVLVHRTAPGSVGALTKVSSIEII